jgi:predicted molibdopterin-dependent oxidoreductase YjgC
LNRAQAWINDQAIEICEGETILQAARRLGVEIPTLCYTPGLAPEGGCRLCLVEVSRASRPVGACHTPIQPGMQIATHTEKLESLRREILALYLEADEDREFRTDSQESEFTRLLARYRLQAKPVARASRPLWRERPAPAREKVSSPWPKKSTATTDEGAGRMPTRQRARRPRYFLEALPHTLLWPIMGSAAPKRVRRLAVPR